MSYSQYELELDYPNWKELGAACLEDDVDVDWFDDDVELHDGSRARLYAATVKAKEICARCPIDAYNTCFEYHISLPTSHDHGVRAGFTRQERLALRKLGQLTSPRRKAANAS